MRTKKKKKTLSCTTRLQRNGYETKPECRKNTKKIHSISFSLWILLCVFCCIFLLLLVLSLSFILQRTMMQTFFTPIHTNTLTFCFWLLSAVVSVHPILLLSRRNNEKKNNVKSSILHTAELKLIKIKNRWRHFSNRNTHRNANSRKIGGWKIAAQQNGKKLTKRNAKKKCETTAWKKNVGKITIQIAQKYGTIRQ